jgi:predicted metalloenzyme YecM
MIQPLPDPTPFLQHLFAALHADGLEVEDMELDHLCYRVATAERYATCKELIAQQGTLLAESLIAGRPIATYRLHQGFRFRERIIDVVELPSPKPGSTYPEGYEHAEFVVDEDLLVFTQRYPKLAWELDDLYKPTNADVHLRYPGFSVKFHRQRLSDVIATEQRDQR